MADIKATSLEGIIKGTTAQRPNSPDVGILYYNTDLNYFENYTVNGWFPIAVSPTTPTAIVATNQGSGRAYNNGRAFVSFTAATTGGDPTSFIVRPSPSTSPATFTGSSSPVTATNLLSNTEYTYTVVSSSAYGNSSDSAASSGVTATTVPQAPTIGAAVGANASATVAYTTGATGGSAITTFTATSSPGGLTGTGSSPITVSGLTNGTAYTFTVTATNANGTSAASAASNSITPSPTYAIGSTGPGGGIVFYDAGSTLSWGRYLEADISGGSSGKWVYNLAYTYIGTTQTGIGTGRQNTANIYPTTTSGTGAYYTWNYSAGGFSSINNAATGWFLPSIDELYQMNLQKVILGIDGVGYTWSSSEDSQYFAWRQNFGGAGQGVSNKNFAMGFYPVRAF